jgi:hypothetical protein
MQGPFAPPRAGGTQGSAIHRTLDSPPIRPTIIHFACLGWDIHCITRDYTFVKLSIPIFNWGKN